MLVLKQFHRVMNLRLFDLKRKDFITAGKRTKEVKELKL